MPTPRWVPNSYDVRGRRPGHARTTGKLPPGGHVDGAGSTHCSALIDDEGLSASERTVSETPFLHVSCDPSGPRLGGCAARPGAERRPSWFVPQG